MRIPESVKQAAFEAAYETGFGVGRPHINRIVKATMAAIEDHPDMNAEEHNDVGIHEQKKSPERRNVFSEQDSNEFGG